MFDLLIVPTFYFNDELIERIIITFFPESQDTSKVPVVFSCEYPPVRLVACTSLSHIHTPFEGGHIGVADLRMVSGID